MKIKLVSRIIINILNYRMDHQSHQQMFDEKKDK